MRKNGKFIEFNKQAGWKLASIKEKNVKNLSQHALLSRSSECIRMDKQIQFCQNKIEGTPILKLAMVNK